MLHLYTSVTTFLINGRLVRTEHVYKDKLQEDIPENTFEYFNWDDICETSKKVPLNHFFKVEKKKRGLVFRILCNCLDYEEYKQWRDELNIQVITEWEEIIPSLNQLLNFHDGNKAIEYLVERGMNCIPIK